MSVHLLVVVGLAATLAAAVPAAGASEADCRMFHEECLVARAQGERDAGICNVERLECSTAPTPGSRTGESDTRHDARTAPRAGEPERSTDSP